MSNSFNLPRNPADFRPPPIRTDKGVNLFADAESVVEAVLSENAYAPPTDTGGPTYRPANYETTIPHRGGLVLGLGITGHVTLVLGIALLVVLGLVEGIEAPIIISPVLIFNLIFTLPAWVMSWLDMKAIEAGAMHGEGSRKTRLGGWLGILATFLTLLFALPAIVVAVYWIWLDIQSSM